MSTIHTLSLRMANAYLIEAPGGLYLIDAGMPGDHRHILHHMQKLGLDNLKLIFITHAHIDHYGSAATLKRITSAKIAIHAADEEAMADGRTELGEVRGRGRVIGWIMPMINALFRDAAVQADLVLEDGDNLDDYGLHARIIHTPGHTPGSCSLWVDGRDAFVGDLLSTSSGAHAQRYYASNWAQISGSLARLAAIEPKKIYPGHGRQTMGNDELKSLIDSK